MHNDFFRVGDYLPFPAPHMATGEAGLPAARLQWAMDFEML